MANHKSAKKRHLQSEKKRTRNRSVKSALATQVKKARVELTNKSAEPNAGEIRLAQQALAVAARKGVITKKTAARRTSRLMQQAHQIAQAK
jgi:small subunit ribosomal protein S20